eukprot:765988-Hanusia_phi.AAC.10
MRAKATWQVAAAIAYDLDKNDSGQQTILVFSMGARSCEVVVLDVNTGCFQERCVQVDHLLGGDAIDDVLVDWFVDQFKRKHKLDPSESHSQRQVDFNVSVPVVVLKSTSSTQNINKVVMVGGCSRIPKVQSLVQQAFPGESRALLSSALIAPRRGGLPQHPPGRGRRAWNCDPRECPGGLVLEYG